MKGQYDFTFKIKQIQLLTIKNKADKGHLTLQVIFK